MGLKELPKSKQAAFWTLAALAFLLAFSFDWAVGKLVGFFMLEAVLLVPAYILLRQGDKPATPTPMAAAPAAPAPAPQTISYEKPVEKQTASTDVPQAAKPKRKADCGLCGNWGICYGSTAERDAAAKQLPPSFNCGFFQKDPTVGVGPRKDVGKSQQ